MRKRELVFAALAAALLSVGTARTASAVEAGANCDWDCVSTFGFGFYQPTYWFDDFGNLGEPGDWGYAGCEEVGDTTICYYAQ